MISNERSIFDAIHPSINDYETRQRKINDRLADINETSGDLKREIPLSKLPTHLAAAIDLAHLNQPSPKLPVTCAVHLTGSGFIGYPEIHEKIFGSFIVSWPTEDPLAIAKLQIEQGYSAYSDQVDLDVRKLRTVKTRESIPFVGKEYETRAQLLALHLTDPRYAFYKTLVMEELLKATDPKFPIDQLRPTGS